MRVDRKNFVVISACSLAATFVSSYAVADWREILREVAKATLEERQRSQQNDASSQQAPTSGGSYSPEAYPLPTKPITDYSQEYRIYLAKRSFNDACTDGPRRSEHEYSNADCSQFILDSLSKDLKAKKIEPTDCREYGIYAGFNEPPLNMKVSLTGGAGSIVSFTGSVEDGNSNSLIVFNSNYGSPLNASVRFSKQTKIMKNVSIGGYASGFGRVTGSMPVTLVSGQQTRIPVINAICLN